MKEGPPLRIPSQPALRFNNHSRVVPPGGSGCFSPKPWNTSSRWNTLLSRCFFSTRLLKVTAFSATSSDDRRSHSGRPLLTTEQHGGERRTQKRLCTLTSGKAGECVQAWSISKFAGSMGGFQKKDGPHCSPTKKASRLASWSKLLNKSISAGHCMKNSAGHCRCSLCVP